MEHSKFLCKYLFLRRDKRDKRYFSEKKILTPFIISKNPEAYSLEGLSDQILLYTTVIANVSLM